MNRQEFAAYLSEAYSSTGEYLFARYPNFQVFRHTQNRKWCAVLMDIPGKNPGLEGGGEISIVNLKSITPASLEYAGSSVLSDEKIPENVQAPAIPAP